MAILQLKPQQDGYGKLIPHDRLFYIENEFKHNRKCKMLRAARGVRWMGHQPLKSENVARQPDSHPVINMEQNGG